MRLTSESLNKNGGFTLIETIVTVLIFCLMITCLIIVCAAGQNAWQIGDNQIQLLQETRKISAKLGRELYESAQAQARVVNIGGNDNIIFQVPVDADGDGDVVDAADNVEWGATRFWGCNQPGPGCYAQNWEIRYGLVGNQLVRMVIDQFGVEQANLRMVVANNISGFTPQRVGDTINFTVTSSRNTQRGYNLHQSNISGIRFRN